MLKIIKNINMRLRVVLTVEKTMISTRPTVSNSVKTEDKNTQVNECPNRRLINQKSWITKSP